MQTSSRIIIYSKFYTYANLLAFECTCFSNGEITRWAFKVISYYGGLQLRLQNAADNF